MRKLESQEKDLYKQIHILTRHCRYESDFLYKIPLKHFNYIMDFWNEEQEAKKREQETK